MTRALALAVACLAACQPSFADPQPPPRERFERDMMIRFHMHENFDLLRAIERLLIRGKLDDAKRFAVAISEAPDEPGLGAWTGHAGAVRAAAAALGRATTLDDACRKEARLAAACASCHVAIGVDPAFTTRPPVPPDRPDVAARMLRHRWAADRLWEGIVGGADEPWLAGLDLLAAAPLPLREPFAKNLQRAASGARKHPDRAAAYGEILAICAGCHTAP